MKLPLPLGIAPLDASFSDCTLVRQHLSHTAADYAAVMASREHLRGWSGDSWPEDDFTEEDNRADLAGHIEEAEEGFAYGYTVFAKGEESVLGSVYFYPAAFFAGRYHFTASFTAALVAAQVAIDYWLRPEREAADSHRAFVRDLVDWARRDWGYTQAVFLSRPAMAARRDLLERIGAQRTVEAAAIHTPGWRQSFQRLDLTTA